MDVLTLYREHKLSVYRLALSYTRSAAEAEDICQAVFLKLLERQPRLEEGKEKSYLCTMTANLCRDALRRTKRHPTEPLTPDIPFEDPAENELLDAVMRLGERERSVVHLYYYEGYSTAEIAEILGIKPSAVTSRLARARKHLRRRMEENSYDDEV